MDKKKKQVSGINFQMIIEGTTPLGTECNKIVKAGKYHLVD